jgi:hypothetical protein
VAIWTALRRDPLEPDPDLAEMGEPDEEADELDAADDDEMLVEDDPDPDDDALWENGR